MRRGVMRQQAWSTGILLGLLCAGPRAVAQVPSTVDIEVQVEATNQNAEPWDIGDGAPDLVLCLGTGSTRSCLPHRCDDSFLCRFTDVRWEGERITIVDRDALADDIVGEGTCTPSGACVLGRARLEISHETPTACAPGDLLCAPRVESAAPLASLLDRGPRPSTSPDFHVVSVAGHAADDSVFSRDYLAEAGTVAAVLRTIESRGFTAATFAATDNYESQRVPQFGPTGLVVGYSDETVNGFDALLAHLETIGRRDISAWDNPSRVVIVAHSHGVVWAHLALLVLEERGIPIPVEVLVDLDGTSYRWEADGTPPFVGDHWGRHIREHVLSPDEWPFPFWDAAEDYWDLPGVSDADAEDVVPAGVVLNLEVWSNSLPPVHDRDENHRRDGTHSGIETLRHCYALHHDLTPAVARAVYVPTSDAMEWVLSRLGEHLDALPARAR